MIVPFTHPRRRAALSLAVALSGVSALPAAAQDTRLAVDVSAGGSYSTNPFLIRGDAEGAVATELMISPQLTVVDERNEASLIAHYRRSDYLNRYNAAEGYGVQAQARRALTSTLSARADVSYESSIVGQSGLGVVGVVDPNPGPDLGTPDISLIGLNQRQNSLVASLGADWRFGPRDTLTGRASANRISYGGESGALLSSQTTGATLGYSRALSERTSVGFQGTGSWTDYDRRGFSGASYSPQGTLSHQIDQRLRFSLGLGAVFISSTTPLRTTKATGFSGTFDGCRTAGRSAQCVRAFSDAQATGLGDISRRYGGSFDYSYRLRENDVLRGMIDYSRLTATSDTLQVPQVGFLSGIVSYERSFTQRLFVGASAGYRQATGGGLGNPSDLTFRLFLRTRLGDRR